MTQSIQAWLYSSTTADVHDSMQEMQIAQGGGDTSLLLDQSYVLEDAIQEFEDQANAAGHAGTYTFALGSNVVTFDNDASNFEITFEGNLAAYLGYSGDLSGADTYSSDQQPEALFSAIKYHVEAVASGDDVKVERYRLGRTEALAFGNYDLHELTLILTSAEAASFVESLCVTGRIRASQNDGDSTAWSATNADGYIDGYVASTSDLVTLGSSEAHVQMRVLVAVPR